MDEESLPQEAKTKPSQIPSWVSLGFAIGALFVMALPKRAAVAPAEPAPAEQPAVKPAAPAQMTTIEAVFAAWGQYAQWSGPVCQVGLWNPETKGYSDFYEVLKMGDVLFFRSIPALTSPVVSQGIPSECPLEFAQGSRSDAAQEQRRADMSALSRSFRETFGQPELPKPPKAK